MKLQLRPTQIATALVAASLLVALPLEGARAQDTSRPRITLGWGNKTPTPTPTPAAAQTNQFVYANAASVVIRSGTSPTSSIVATASKGERLQVLENLGQRLRVRTNGGASGYVVKMNTSVAAPVQSDGGFGGLLRDNRGAGEQSSGGSIRGLRPGRPPIPTTGTLNLDMGATMLVQGIAESITDAEVEAFMTAGGVTPP